jgi:hypothetical protein
MLELDIGEQPAKAIVIHAKWLKAMATMVAGTHALVASLFLAVPGTPFEPVTEPKVGKLYKGVKVTEDLFSPLMISHVKYLTAISDQLMALFFVIVSCLGNNILSMLATNTIFTDNRLHIPSGDKVHLLLKAIHAVCTKREGSSPEASYADTMESLANLRMGRSSFQDYCEEAEAMCSAARSSGIEISEAQEVEFTVRGLEGDFLPVKQALISAAAVSGNGLPATRAAFKAAAVRIEGSLGNETSAFSTKVKDATKAKDELKQAGKGGKTYSGDQRVIFDEGFKAGAKKGDAKVKVIEEQLAAAKLTIAELEKQVAEKGKDEVEQQRTKPAGFSKKNVPADWRSDVKARKAAEAYAASFYRSDSSEEEE